MGKRSQCGFGRLGVLILSAVLSLAGAGALSGRDVITSGPEKGTLFVHGGGSVNFRAFSALIKDTNNDGVERVVVISTALGKRRRSDPKFQNGISAINSLERLKMGRVVSELYLMEKQQARSEKAVGLIERADAIWMTGGNQSYLTDVFNGTPALDAMRQLLERGGVVGGASAGAQVQSSFMTRGDFTKRLVMGDGRHQVGFGLVRSAAFDVHVAARNRNDDLFEIYNSPKSAFQDQAIHPQDLLGIGIDESTAVIIRHEKMSVVGNGKVYVFDARKWNSAKEPFYDTLSSGDEYDLRNRRQFDRK